MNDSLRMMSVLKKKPQTTMSQPGWTCEHFNFDSHFGARLPTISLLKKDI
jgi:hypothetical protein